MKNMELKYNINELASMITALERRGFKFVKKENDSFYYELERHVCVLKPIITYRDFKLVNPDYNDSSLTIVSSMDNYFGFSNKYPTNKELDELLKEKKFKHVCYCLLDGFGSKLIEDNLDDDAILKKNMVRDMSAVYPSTTACAIPAFASGLEPVETAWIGWNNYFESLDTDVVMFSNTDYFTGEKLDINTRVECPYEEFFKKYDNYFYYGPTFYGKENGFKSFKKMMKTYLKNVNDKPNSVGYLYWGDPDHTFHEKGCHSKKGIKVCKKLNKVIDKASKKLNDDTLLIVSADHGHIDSYPIYLKEFPDVRECFKRVPSVDSRALVFSIKDDMKERFVSLFNKYFDAYFKLYTKEEFLEKKFLGNSSNINSHLDSFLGDYIAVATNQYYFVISDDYDQNHPFKSHHAGLTADEMRIPLIFIYKQ